MTETLDSQLANLSAGAHVCPIYTTAEEQMAALVPFLRAGLARGEQCLYVADAGSVDAVVRLLEAEGIATQAAIDRGALVLLIDRASYLRQGRFDPESMYQLLRGAAEVARSTGFAGLSIAGEMTWIAGPDPGELGFLECEARLNDLPPELGTRIICQYDRRRFPPRVLHDVLRVHPLVILGEHVHENVYFDPWALVPGDESVEAARVESMLEQLQARTRRQTAAADLGRLSLAGARPTDLLAAATELIVAELGVEFAEVLVRDPTNGSMRVAASAGWPPCAVTDTTDLEIDALAWALMDAGLPVVVPDWGVEARFKQPQALASAGIVSSVLVGLRSRPQQRLEGVVGLHSSCQRLFSDDEVVFLDSIAIHLAHACRMRRMEEEFRALVDNAVDVVARLDRALRYVYVNPAIEGVLGVAADTLIGKTIFELGLPESLTRVWELTSRRVWQTGREQATEFRLTTANGERLFGSRVIPELAPDGSVEFVVTVWRDVTAQHLAELERAEVYRDLRTGQQQLQELVVGLRNGHAREVQRVVDGVQLERLTAQEQTVLQLVAKGWTNREIGAQLGRTPGTVKNYVAVILSKLSVSDRTQAAVRAVELGLLDRTLAEDPSDAATIR